MTEKPKQPTVEEFVRASTKASSVPVKVRDKAVLVSLARMLKKP